MKITAFIICAFAIHVSASTLAQTVTLSEHKASLEKVINDIKQQTGYSFFYNQDWLQQAKPVSLEVKNQPLEKVLKECFINQPLDFAVVNQTIVLKLKEIPVVNPNAPSAAQQVIVTGKVQNELGEPMAGVTVKQKDNPGNGTVTDAKGNYTISVPNDKSVLVFSYIGYDPQELAAKDIPLGSVVTLKVAENNLREVVINKGYYYEKKELSTGDVSVVSSKTIEQQPVSDPIQALIGQVPGLNIQQTSGVPGSYATIHIRGLNSIGAGNDPFYVVDGIPYNSISLTNPGFTGGAVGKPQLNAIQSGGVGLSPFNSLNPDDIADIEVLKDADATAIYGSRGANGVILITTKKGKLGETKVNIDMQQGIGQVGHFMDMLNTQQYLQMRHQAYANDGIATIPSNAYDINGVWDTSRYTNWEKTLIGGTAHYTNAQASISGGNANTQFVISGGYNRQTTVYPDDFDDQKGSLHISLTNTSNNQKFKAVFTAGYVNENNNMPQADLTNSITVAPDAPALYTSNGSFNWQLLNGAGTFSNPLLYTLRPSSAIDNNLISNLNLSYKLFPGLILSAGLGYNHNELNQTNIIPAISVQPPTNTNTNNRQFYVASDVNQGWIIEPQLSYDRRIGKGQVHILLGASIQQNSTQDYANRAAGFSSDAMITNPASATTYALVNNIYSLYRYKALVGRLGYTWDDKYLLNVTANRDGSTRFGPGRQYGNFGAVGAGWIFSKEKWIENTAPWLSFGKLRLSYGTTGNDQIGDYQFLSTYSANSSTYQGVSQLMPNGLANADFNWEVDKKLEGGLDLGFLKDRIDISISYYRNRTGNQLVGYTVPTITGFYSVEYNLPAVIQNTGLEAELHTFNIKTNNFTWSSSVNFTLPQNKLISYPNFDASPYTYSYAVGQSLFIKYLYQYTGVNSQTGLYSFKTSNPNGLPSFEGESIPSIPITQKYYGGFGNDFSYNGFGLSVFIQFVNQVGYNYFNAYRSGPGTVNTNFPTAVLSAWSSPGDATAVERFSTKNPAQYTDYRSSTGILTDASFVRIKNAQLYYRLPARWQTWAHTQNARIYAEGQNLYTFTKYIGLDPETQGLSLPPLRVITVGVSATF